MADLLGAAFSITNGLSDSAESPMDVLLDSFRKSRSGPVDILTGRKSELEKRQVFFNGLRSRLDALADSIRDFDDAEDSIDKFKIRSAESSNSDGVSVAAGEDSKDGVYTVRVNRLATSDILVSNRVNAEDAFALPVVEEPAVEEPAVEEEAPVDEGTGEEAPVEEGAEGDSGIDAPADEGGAEEGVEEVDEPAEPEPVTGTFEFDITVDGETETFSINLDGTETFADVATRIAEEINDSDLNVSAGAVFDTTDTVRLSLVSQDTGSENQITFGDDDGLLSAFGLTEDLFADGDARTTFNDESAGFRKSSSSALDSEFEMNGITIQRSTNVVSDVVNDLTFTLKRVTDEDEQDIRIDASLDVDKVKNNVSEFLTEYNDVLNYLNTERQTARADFAASSLRSDLRTYASRQYESGNEDIRYLSDLGIEIDSNGFLTVGDEDILQGAVNDDPEAAAALIESFALVLKERVEGMVEDDGIIETRKTSIASQIDSYQDRIERLESQIDRQAENLRKQYTSLQESYLQAQNQYSQLFNFQ